MAAFSVTRSAGCKRSVSGFGICLKIASGLVTREAGGMDLLIRRLAGRGVRGICGADGRAGFACAFPYEIPGCLSLTESVYIETGGFSPGFHANLDGA